MLWLIAHCADCTCLGGSWGDGEGPIHLDGSWATRTCWRRPHDQSQEPSWGDQKGVWLFRLVTLLPSPQWHGLCFVTRADKTVIQTGHSPSAGGVSLTGYSRRLPVCCVLSALTTMQANKHSYITLWVAIVWQCNPSIHNIGFILFILFACAQKTLHHFHVLSLLLV